MDERCAPCAFEKVAEVEFRNLAKNLDELKGRVARVEQMLTRGTLLLVANLAGMVVRLLLM